MRNFRQPVLTVDVRQELRILDGRPRLDRAKRIFGCDELLMRQHVVFFGGLSKMFAEQIPASKYDVGVVRETFDTHAREREPVRPDDALLQKLDTGCHRRSNRSAKTDHRDSKFSFRHKRSASLQKLITKN